jgi:uncharacterized protein
MKRIFFTMLFVLLSTVTVYSAELPKPIPNMYVHDFATVIPIDKLSNLDEQAKLFKSQLQCEVAIVIINSLNGEDQFEYSLQIAREWGIGSKDGGIRGFLILIAIQDRKTSVRTSRHIEGQLTDSFTGEVSREMNKFFKKNDFYGGLSLGLAKFKERLEKGDVQPPTPTSESDSGNVFIGILFFGIIPILFIGTIGLIVSKRRKRKRLEEMRYRSQITTDKTEFFKKIDTSRARVAAQLNSNTRTPSIRRSYSSAPIPASNKKEEPKKSIKKEEKKRDDDSYTPTSSYGYSSPSSSYSSSDSSSSSSDSSSSYSGGSDYGGGGSDSSW